MAATDAASAALPPQRQERRLPAASLARAASARCASAATAWRTRSPKSAGAGMHTRPRRMSPHSCQRSWQPDSSSSCCKRRSTKRASSAGSSPSINADSCCR